MDNICTSTHNKKAVQCYTERQQNKFPADQNIKSS